MEKMLETLENIRKESKEEFSGSILTALGNGKEIVGILNDSYSDGLLISEYLERGYWVVNNFYEGNPIGLGI